MSEFTEKKLEFEPKEWIHNPFIIIFADALMCAHLSEDPKHPEPVRGMLVRTSIMHSVLAIECVANCVVAKIPRNHRFRVQAERWPALDKYDLYLLCFPHQRSIPRDNEHVKVLRELISLRDSYVHPRATNFPITRIGEQDGKPKMTSTVEVKSTPKLAPMSFAWTTKDAKIVLKSLVEFFRLFFVELCGFKPDTVGIILSTVVKCSDGDRIADIGDYRKVLGLSKTLELEISFMGLNKV
jgi:hypothetical protein